MFLRELYEAPSKTAVLAFGRLNPPTIGHAKLVDAITSQDGDHYLFLSQSQKPKTDPLDFTTKMKFAKQFFPGVNVGHQSVRTPVQALEMLQSLGYTDVIFIAGSDRVDGFQKLFDTYNGKADKSGKIPFKFNSIRVVSAGERDPDADDVSGMSASKMRAAAAAGDLETFAKGVPDAKLAKTMYDAVRKGMGVKDAETVEDARPLGVVLNKPKSDTLIGKAADKLNAWTDKLFNIMEKYWQKQVDQHELAWKEVENLLKPYAEELRDLINDPQDLAMLMFLIKHNQSKKPFMNRVFAKIKRHGLRGAYALEKKLVQKFGEDVSPEDEKKFHNELDDLVHKYFGDSPDEVKMKKKMRKVKEGSPISDLKKIITSKVYKKEYLMALKMMKDESISAANAARRFMHVDARTLDKMAEKIGVTEGKQRTGSAGQAKGKDPMPKAEPGRTKHPLKDKLVGEANYGRYYCSTDKKWKQRKSPKKSRKS